VAQEGYFMPSERGGKVRLVTRTGDMTSQDAGFARIRGKPIIATIFTLSFPSIEFSFSSIVFSLSLLLCFLLSPYSSRSLLLHSFSCSLQFSLTIRPTHFLLLQSVIYALDPSHSFRSHYILSIMVIAYKKLKQ